MKNILFYGNCQVTSICTILNLHEDEYNTQCIECFSTEILEYDFLEILKNADIIITQMIHTGYRGKEYLTTMSLFENIRPDCQIIFFNNLYFNFYYFDLCFKPIQTGYLDKPSLYHYNQLIDHYKNGKQINNYIDDVVNNDYFMSQTDLNQMAENSLNDLTKRHDELICLTSQIQNKKIIIINVIEFIKNQYKNKLLFHTFNHPRKELLHEICHQIIDILHINNTVNYDIDPFDWYKGILYKCIQPVVSFDISTETPTMNDKTDIKKICQLYYDAYLN